MSKQIGIDSVSWFRNLNAYMLRPHLWLRAGIDASTRSSVSFHHYVIHPSTISTIELKADGYRQRTFFCQGASALRFIFYG